MSKPLRIGFYGGTFDPPHFGHLNLSQQILEAHQLDAVWFCPAFASPDKLHEKTTPAKHRLAMCELAITNYPGFQVIRHEVERGGASFTVATLRALIEAHPQNQFYLILGDETVPTFGGWQSPGEILTMAKPLVGRRLPRDQPFPSCGDARLDLLLKEGFTDTAVMEISATAVRGRLRRGLPCAHLVPSLVLKYIEENGIHF